MSALTNYLQQFASLKRAPLANSPLTLNKYPNKAILLLAILDLIGGGFFEDNHLFISPELSDAFDRYWEIAAPEVSPRNIRIPFEKLASSSFWHLTEDRHPFTRVRIAQFDRQLFMLARDATARAALQNVLIETYFAKEIQPALRASTTATEASLRLSEAQLRKLDIVRDAPPEKVRSQAFRTTVVRAYDYRCAICGIRIFSADGRTAVEAAHIKPWSISRDDDPTNGLSLCKLCHWSFDAGLLAVSRAYIIVTSKRLTRDRNLGGHLLAIGQRAIFAPEDADLQPDRERLEWHRETIFAS